MCIETLYGSKLYIPKYLHCMCIETLYGCKAGASRTEAPAFVNTPMLMRSRITTRGANRNPNFLNSETVRIPIRCSDGQQPIFSDNFGQTQLPT